MSKRHQSSRRKTYGRRQHEVHERQRPRHSTAEGFELELDELGLAPPGRPARLPRSAQPRASASRSATERMAVYEGARPRTIVLPAAPAGRRAARRSPRRRVRGAVRAGRRPNRLGARPRGDRRRVPARVLLARPDRSASRRPGYDIGRLSTERDAPRRPRRRSSAPT